MRPQRLVSMLLLALAPAIGLAEMYSWKDASGKTHYGDKPPTSQQADSRQIAAPQAPADAQASRKSFLENQRVEREKQAEEEKKKSEAEKAPSPPPGNPPPPPPAK